MNRFRPEKLGFRAISRDFTRVSNGFRHTLFLHGFLAAQEDQHGHTPLLWAVRHGMFGAMQLLLRPFGDLGGLEIAMKRRHGALASHADHRGLTALHWCCALGFSRLCKLLLADQELTEAHVKGAPKSRRS